jgi:hypothetical protein
MNEQIDQLESELKRHREAMQLIVQICKRMEELTISVLAQSDLRSIRQIAEQYSQKNNS